MAAVSPLCCPLLFAAVSFFFFLLRRFSLLPAARFLEETLCALEAFSLHTTRARALAHQCVCLSVVGITTRFVFVSLIT